MLPSGEQYLLSDGRQEAVVTEVGATLRRYDVDGRTVCWGFGEQEMSTGGRGQVLAPWPNRLEDGRYVHDGTVGRAALDEPERANAIHGLVRWLPWRVERRSPQAVRCSCMLPSQPGYPFSVSVGVDYRLVDEGLVVSAGAENLGRSRAPFGIGFHNYLHAAGNLNACQVRLPARRRLVVDERMLPRAVQPVAGGPIAPLCGEEPHELGSRVLDDCLTDLAEEDDGCWRVRFVPASGEAEAVTVWVETPLATIVLGAEMLTPVAAPKTATCVVAVGDRLSRAICPFPPRAFPRYCAAALPPIPMSIPTRRVNHECRYCPQPDGRDEAARHARGVRPSPA